jgi:hypothetical protein
VDATGSAPARPTRVVTASGATASSVHDPEIEAATGTRFEYPPSNMSDGSRETAWFEGAAGTGTGEWVEFSFDAPVTLTAVYIQSGYWRNATRLAENARVKRLRVTLDSGRSEEFGLVDPVTAGWPSADGIDGEKLTLSQPQSTRTVRLTILDVYPGSRWDDVGITDVVFEAGT